MSGGRFTEVSRGCVVCLEKDSRRCGVSGRRLLALSTEEMPSPSAGDGRAIPIAVGARAPALASVLGSSNQGMKLTCAGRVAAGHVGTASGAWHAGRGSVRVLARRR